ncbi:MFS transporter [Caenimonas sp. SL110]|uniref:MFS transporter n=1 Tax=Caenimonas sp. SL110 TaxID=1450524 RepID=UPI0006535E42|nr:MFS transporter [Caenimonas sp. SL110]
MTEVGVVRDGWRYGLLGLPLAFVALPLYVQLPNHYGREFGVSLAALGAVLLGARLFDAFLDPWIGRVIDRLFARSSRAVVIAGAAAAGVLALGFVLLFFPPVRGQTQLLAWASMALLVTYAGFSVLTIAHQSWGAMLGGDEAQRSRVVAWREGFGLIGVLVASALPLLAGLPVSAFVLAVALAAGCWAWASSRHPRPSAAAHHGAAVSWLQPLRHRSFRTLLGVFLLNGIASAIPATLVLFFVQDRLQAPRTYEPLFLGIYFLAAALSIPLWLRMVAQWGLARSWLGAMVLALVVFTGAATLGAGDTAAFFAVCALSGFALGADLSMPGAMLAGVIAQAGERGRGEGAFFGWWNFATKLNLALAAGIALPLLALAGYAPGERSEQALWALTTAYCLVPCVLKLAAATLLYFTVIRPGANP